MTHEELEYGLICLGVALIDSAGRPVGAISISGPSSRMTKENIEKFAKYLVDFGCHISDKL